MSLAFACLAIGATFVLRFAYKRANAKRDAMPLEEIRAKYTDQELLDLGDSKQVYADFASIMLTNAPQNHRSFAMSYRIASVQFPSDRIWSLHHMIVSACCGLVHLRHISTGSRWKMRLVDPTWRLRTFAEWQ